MKSHYSQTPLPQALLIALFYYLMKSHYSQTFSMIKNFNGGVLLPYEITLFSNLIAQLQASLRVLLPYEITLFSNRLCKCSVSP